eukprot:16867-Heterococcus_DN1.PRE.2
MSVTCMTVTEVTLYLLHHVLSDVTAPELRVVILDPVKIAPPRVAQAPGPDQRLGTTIVCNNSNNVVAGAAAAVESAVSTCANAGCMMLEHHMSNSLQRAGDSVFD